MPGGGKLTLETGNVHLDEDYADMHGEVTAGDYVLIAVSDTGTGIPAAVSRQGLRPVLHHKGSRQGNRLGLSMVYGFVKQSAGQSRSTARKATAPRSRCTCRARPEPIGR